MSSERAAPVGLIGMGVMGSILARRLLEQGFAVVVFNRSPQATRPLHALGASVAATPADVAAQCEHIFTVLPGPDALHSVLFGEHGALAGGALTINAADTPRHVVCDLSTQDPLRLQALAAQASAQGAILVEAPMAGSVHDATHGSLKFMFGGDAAVLRELAPYFGAWGPSPTHFGALGQANTAKLALNLLVGVMAKGLAEAVHLLQSSQTPLTPFLEVLDASGLRSPLYQRLAQRYTQDDTAVRFSLAHLRKDLAFCQAHPAWAGHDPVLLGALHATLSALTPEQVAGDYSSLIGLERARSAASPRN